MESLKEKALAVLRWSERYTKTDMVYLTKGGSWLLFGHIVQMATGLVLMVAFTNLVSKETYGTYQFVMSGAAIITGFTLSGMATAISRAVARGSDGSLPYGFRKQAAWNIGVIIAGVATAAYYYAVGDAELAIAFVLVGVFESLLSGFSLYRAFLIGKELFKESVALGMWRRSIPVVALLVALFLTESAVVLVLVYYVSSTLATGLMYLLVRKKHPALPEPDPELVSYSKHLSFVGLATRIMGNIDKMLIFFFLGPAQVATYTVALFPIAHVETLFGLAGKLVLPKFSRQELPTLRKTLPRKVALFSGAIVVTVAAYIALVRPLFELFFPAYPEAILLTQVAILSILMKPRSMFEQVFNAQGMTRAFYISRISSAVVKVGLLVILIPMHGLWGAVWALLATHAYSSIISTVLFYGYKNNHTR